MDLAYSDDVWQQKLLKNQQTIVKLTAELVVIDTRLKSPDISEERKVRLSKHRKILVNKSIPELRKSVDSLHLVV